MDLSIATWNINSVRLRLPLVLRFLAEQKPSVLCLQETKCPDELFPADAFREAGYGHVLFRGQKGYNGVAIVSRHPLNSIPHLDFCAKGDARHICAEVAPKGKGARSVRVHNLYIPAGGDIPDVKKNPKFGHKLQFLSEFEAFASDKKARRGDEVIVGDLNIAPLVNDVWNHKSLLGVVSHTPVETEALERIRKTGGWIDTMRHLKPEPERLYTWWSYRSPDWSAADKGRRLDHIWASPGLEGALRAFAVHRDVRGWEQPSDHAPVLLNLKF